MATPFQSWEGRHWHGMHEHDDATQQLPTELNTSTHPRFLTVAKDKRTDFTMGASSTKAVLDSFKAPSTPFIVSVRLLFRVVWSLATPPRPSEALPGQAPQVTAGCAHASTSNAVCTDRCRALLLVGQGAGQRAAKILQHPRHLCTLLCRAVPAR